MDRPRVAVTQLTSTTDGEANWQAAKSWIELAAERGAQLVATPENTNFLGSHLEKAKVAEALDGPTCRRFAGLAKKLKIFLLLGSFNERSHEPHRCYNTSVLFGPAGERLAVYRKIHLFDVDLSSSDPTSAVRFVESAHVKPADQVVSLNTEFAHLGLSICYDLRFPELYRRQSAAGAQVLLVPSAFTVPTGRAHWLLLLRAKAVENQCFVVAPAQVGTHGRSGRETFGHSVIIDPWGEVLAQLNEGPGIAIADLDLDRLTELRRSMPVLKHRRL